MSASNDSAACAKNCRVMAIIGAVLLWLILWLGADWSFLGSLLVAAILGFLAYYLLRMMLCSGTSDAMASSGTASSVAESAGASGAQASASTSAATPEPASAPAPAANSADEPGTTSSSLMSDAGAGAEEAAADTPKVKPSKPLAGQAELAGRKGNWKYEAAPAAAAPKKKAPAKKAAPKKDAAAKPKRAPVAADGQPELYDAPPAEGADDLKLISGVGPKLEQTLNDMGIYRFAQVAGWRKKEIAWVDSRLKFKGRIERDDWMSQAKILAKGGETEFSKRKKK